MALVAAVLFIPAAGAADSPAPVLLPDSYTTSAAASETFCASGSFPSQWTWDRALTTNAPQPATSGTPAVKQYRNGALIATYSILGSGNGDNCTTDNMYLHPVVECGPFGRVHTWRNWNEGDVFEVYPAVYSGLENQPWIGPLPKSQAEYDGNISTVPKNITIRGITVNGVRPVIKVDAGASYTTLNQSAVYLDQSENITIENIDIEATDGSIGRSGVYLSEGKDITLRDMRIHGFMVSKANGIFGADRNAGTTVIERVELYNNGGDGGPEHNIYMGTSEVDSSYAVHMVNSWSHDAFYGHLFKSRAQVNILEGNYLQGGVPQTGMTQAETYLVDIPNGGLLTMRNNILVKNASGSESNAMSVTFAMEGVPDSRALGLTIEHNTFIALSKYYDGFHPLYPFSFYYPQQVPGAGFPVSNVLIRKNVFAGYCPAGDAVMDYRGDYTLTAGFSDISEDFSLKTNYVPTDSAIVGTTAYRHAAQGGLMRDAATFGAEDAAGVPRRIVTPTPTLAPTLALPGKPRGLSLRVKNKKLTVSWKAASGTVTRYRVDIVSKKKVIKRANLAAGMRKAVFARLRYGAKYTVRVYAGNRTGFGEAAVKNFRFR